MDSQVFEVRLMAREHERLKPLTNKRTRKKYPAPLTLHGENQAFTTPHIVRAQDVWSWLTDIGWPCTLQEVDDIPF